MNLSDCICFKPTHMEEQLGFDKAIEFYQNQIEDGSTDREHFERLAALLRHSHRRKEEIHTLQKAVSVYENLVFTEHLQSVLPVLNNFTIRLKQARSGCVRRAITARINDEMRSMTFDDAVPPDTAVSCANCAACCCRLEVMLITDTGVPREYIAVDRWGGESMARLADGWCAALDRNTLLCTIYDRRPWVCREFEMGAYECLVERTASP